MAQFMRQLKINLPDDVKEWLAEQASRNVRSQSSEVVFALREKMLEETKKADAKA